jgi:O-methyltransferase
VSERVREIEDLSRWAESDVLTGRAPEHLYLDLLKQVLTRLILPDGSFSEGKRGEFDRGAREIGKDWPAEAETMIGLKRLDNLEFCVADVLRRRVPGDLIETGVWRGGAAIFMRAVLEAYGDRERAVWAADSFQGLPKPDPGRASDVEDALWRHPELAVSLEDVKANFARYGFVDDRVRFLAGWFQDTLPTAPIERLAVLRLDGDMYDSTMVALEALYPKVSPGGYVIVDDYGAVAGCRQATDEYRSRNGIGDELHEVDWTCMFWRRDVT